MTDCDWVDSDALSEIWVACNCRSESISLWRRPKRVSPVDSKAGEERKAYEHLHLKDQIAELNNGALMIEKRVLEIVVAELLLPVHRLSVVCK